MPDIAFDRRSLGIGMFGLLAVGAIEPLFAQIPSALPLDRIGIYGEDAALAIIYEDDGGMWLRRGETAIPLWQVENGLNGPGTRIAFAEDGSIELDGISMRRRFLSAEAHAAIQANVNADPDALRRRALAADPPQETGQKRPADLVPLDGPGLTFDITYAGEGNFMGMPIYERPGAFLQREVAEALYRVAADLAPMGYGLVIHDAYRPWFATWMFWEATPPTSRLYVADPAKGSRHNRGCAVDLSLTKLATGEPVEMPSKYDDFSIQAHPDFVGGTERQRYHRDLLRRAMERHGFTVYSAEWWHFDFDGWEDYPITNVTFTELCERTQCPAFGQARH